jgi:hypothetical protein
VEEGEYGGDTMYSCIKMEKNEICWNYSRNGGMKDNDGGVNSTMIYYRTLVNVTMYSQYNNNFLKRVYIKGFI